MARHPRTKAELLEAARHLGYELEQCAAAVRYLRDGRGSDQVLHNALVESVAVHVRLFSDFLLQSTRATDVSRVDFTPQRKWGPTPKDAANRLGEAGPLASKKLAHLTWSRVLEEQRDPGWRFEQLVAGDLLSLFRSWVDHVSDQRGPQDSVVVELRNRWYRAWYFLHATPRT